VRLRFTKNPSTRAIFRHSPSCAPFLHACMVRLSYEAKVQAEVEENGTEISRELSPFYEVHSS
jgi:hypothetical protein